MGIIKDFTEYENLHDLCENHSLDELSKHPNLKDLTLIQEGIIGDFIGGLKDKVLNAISAHIPGGAIKKINRVLARYDDVYYTPKIKEEIELLRKRFEAVAKGKAADPKHVLSDPHNQLILKAWDRRIEANKKKWDAKEKELSLEKRELNDKYKDNHRISKFMDLAFAKLEFNRYKEVEEEYKKLLSEEEGREFAGKVNTIATEVQAKEKEAQTVAASGGEEESIDDKNVKVGQVWQTKDGKDVTISMDLKDSQDRIKELKAKGHDIKKRGYIAKDAEDKEVIVPADELAALKQEAEKTSTEKLSDIEGQLKTAQEETAGLEKGSKEWREGNLKVLKLQLQKIELEKEDGWEEKKSELEDKIKNLEEETKGEYKPGDLVKFSSKSEGMDIIRKVASVEDGEVQVLNQKGAPFPIDKSKIVGKIDSGEKKFRGKEGAIKANVGEEIDESGMNELIGDLKSLYYMLLRDEGENKRQDRISQLVDFVGDIRKARKAGKKLGAVKKLFLNEYPKSKEE